MYSLVLLPFGLLPGLALPLLLVAFRSLLLVLACGLSVVPFLGLPSPLPPFSVLLPLSCRAVCRGCCVGLLRGLGSVAVGLRCFAVASCPVRLPCGVVAFPVLRVVPPLFLLGRSSNRLFTKGVFFCENP